MSLHKRLARFIISFVICAALAAPDSGWAGYHYKRQDKDAISAAPEGELTAVTMEGRTYIPAKQFCGVFGCRAVYQWSKHRLLIENPSRHRVALISHLTNLAIVDGLVLEFTGTIATTGQQGYLLPIDLAQKVANYLGLGRIDEVENEREVVNEAQQNQPLQTLIIDAGHGGADHGTRVGTLTEKDIALIYALKLKEDLAREVPELQIRLTRDSDKFVSLAERTRFANNKGGGLFLSLHVNHAGNPEISGAETFILSPEATDSDARKTALLENEGWMKNSQADEATTSEGIKKIFIDLEQQRFIQNSALFAAYVQQELAQIENGKAVKNRGVKQAFFYVLSQAAMPAVLVEMGFLSNARDRDRLMNVKFRDRFVKALVTAIRRYQLKMQLK